MKHNIKSSRLFFILFSFSIYAQNVDLNKGKPNSKNYFDEITFEWVKEKIIIPVEIEGVNYRFILDTGAPNIISKEIQNAIQPRLISEIPVKDGNGKSDTMYLVSLKTLKLGGTNFKNTPTLVNDLRNNPVFKCFGIDGFIGSNMLRNSIIQIDLEQKKLILTDSKRKLNLKKKNSSKMELVGVQSSPYIWLQLDGEETGREQVLIDTGMDGLYDLSLRHYNIFKKKDIFNVLGASEGASSLSLFGDVPVNNHFRLHLPTLKINNLNLENCILVTTDDDNSRVGTEILHHAIMTIDFKNKRFYLNPKYENVNVLKPEYDFSKTLKNEKLIIGFVWDEDLKQKLSYGDEILEINNKTFDLCDMIITNDVLRTNKYVSLKIKSQNGAMFEIDLEKTNPLLSE